MTILGLIRNKNFHSYDDSTLVPEMSFVKIDDNLKKQYY